MAKQLKDIEIPFGACDSELDGFEYTIPEGYEAEIKDGKVVVRKTESEDEKMIQYFKDLAPFDKADELYEKYGFSHKDAIAWLEKQGGHAKFINGIQVGDKVTRNEDGVLVNLSQLNRVAKKDEKQGKQKDILEDAILDSNKDGLIADTIRYKREKQGEQKPADKVEPKFHEGEWIIHQGTENIYQVTAIVDNQYQLKYGNNYTVQKCADVDRCARLWDIAKDAKDGDLIYVSTEKKGIQAIFHEYKNGTIFFHCYLCRDFVQGGYMPIGSVELVYPLQKVHYKNFFEKMHEAGYEWDADKKELKKIEQKPAWSEKGTNGNDREIPISAWSEEDEAVLDALIRGFEGEHIYVSPFLAIRCLKSLKDRVQPQPKQEWSEEGWTMQDEEELDIAIKTLEEAGQYSSANWLKNVCLVPRPKQEWSGEDERIIDNLVSQLGNLYARKLIKEETKDKYVNWLKSLRPQSTWKPSDEQMKILNEVLNFAANHENPHWNDYIFGTLHNLIIQLKKLRKE